MPLLTIKNVCITHSDSLKKIIKAEIDKVYLIDLHIPTFWQLTLQFLHLKLCL